MIRILLFFLLSFIPFLSTAQQTLSAAAPDAIRVKPNTVVFKLKPLAGGRPDPESHPQLREILAGLQPRSLRQKFPRAQPPALLQAGAIDLSLIYELEYPAGLPLAKVRQQLLASGLVAYVEPLYQPLPLLQPNDPFADSANTNLSQPNQYYLKVIKAYQAWQLAPGDSNLVIGILDTGTRFYHEDLKASVKHNYADPIDGKDNDGDGYVDNFRGWDVADHDNNPTADGNGHGVMMSGISSALPNNGKGLAGVGFRTRFLPLKIFPSTQKGSFAGYEAIVYAADHGCQVINLSWGSPGLRSAFEQDIINYAVINKNAVVVAAAGNTAGELDFYPASYDNVISVGATDDRDLFPSFFSHSPFMDLLAPGIRVWTTGNGADNNYTFGTGTSFAAPIVAGGAALVRQRFPHYTARQVAEQLRMTADPVYHLPNNAAFPERLGRGRLNLLRALTETHVKAVRHTANELSPGRPVYPGDTLQIVATFQNMLAPVEQLAVTLTCNSPYVSILQGSYQAGAMATLASRRNAGQPFRVYIQPNIPTNTVVTFRYGFSDGSYQDYQFFKLTVNPDFVTLNANELAVTVASKGNIGYNGLHYGQGESVVYKKSVPLLSEGGFMIGTSPGQVSDNIRNEKSESSQDFQALAPVRLEQPPVFGDQSAAGLMQDTYPSPGTVGLKVSYRAFARAQAPDRHYVMLEYKVTNTTAAPLSNLYAGLFSDWDIGAANRNAAAWDSAHSLGYVYHVDQRSRYAGVTLLTPLAPTHYAIDNAYGPFANISLADGFSNAEKYRALSNSPQNHQTAGLKGNDVSDVVGARLPDLPPGASVLIAFALVGGDNLAELQAHARAAQSRYRQLKTSPRPVALSDTTCRYASLTFRPAGGRRFKFYADAAGDTLLATGASFTTPPLRATTTYYVSNADSLYESPRVPLLAAVAPAAAFTFSPDPVPAEAGGLVSFRAQRPGAVKYDWDFGDESQGSGASPAHRYRKPGAYTVRLTVTDKKGCTDTVSQVIDIRQIQYNRHWQAEAFIVYPNPSAGGELALHLPEDIDAGNGIALEVLNTIGAVVQRHTVKEAGPTQLQLSGVSAGMYLLRIRGNDGQVIKRIQVLR